MRYALGGFLGALMGSRHLQLVTGCHQLTSLLGKPALELVPVFAGGQVIRLLRQHLHHINDRKPPGFHGFVVHTTDGLAFELGGQVFPTERLSRTCFNGL